MKKILSGFIGLFLVIGIVAGVGYALFNTSASVNGVVLGTASPNLVLCNEVGGVIAEDQCAQTFSFPTNDPFGPLVPGGEDWAGFFLKNNSSSEILSGGNKLNFKLYATIPSAGGQWNDLKDAVEMRVCLYLLTSGTNHCDTTKATSWMTLAEWNAGDIALNVPTLLQGENIHLTVLFRLPISFDNTVAGKTIQDMNITFKGVQQ